MVVDDCNDFVTLLVLVAGIADAIAPFLATVLVPSPWSTLRSSCFSAARCRTLATNADFVSPNGLAFSPDERILYINDSQGVTVREDDIFSSVGHIKAFDVRSNGMLANGRVFCELRGERTGIPDGMKVDVEGHVYCTGPGGVWIMDAAGTHLGTILTGVAHTTNIAWGGADWKTLYITTLASLARIQLKIAGIPVPRSR